MEDQNYAQAHVSDDDDDDDDEEMKQSEKSFDFVESEEGFNQARRTLLADADEICDRIMPKQKTPEKKNQEDQEDEEEESFWNDHLE